MLFELAFTVSESSHPLCLLFIKCLVFTVSESLSVPPSVFIVH